MINIYDGNNYYRKTLETDHTGLAPRGIMNALQLSKEINIWCWDGENANARRREWYPEYKRNRKPVAKDIYAGFDLLKDVLKHTSAIQVEVPGYEADDVIATLTRQYVGYDTVAIYSNDYDLFQLQAEFPNRVFVGAQPKVSVPAKHVRSYKVLVGDPSDNIPGIKGFGEKAWSDLGPEMAEKLIADLTTMDFNPEDYPTLTKAQKNWLQIEPHGDMIVQFWNVVTLIDIPMEELTEHVIQGDGQYEKAEAILKEFML